MTALYCRFSGMPKPEWPQGPTSTLLVVTQPACPTQMVPEISMTTVTVLRSVQSQDAHMYPKEMQQLPFLALLDPLQTVLVEHIRICTSYHDRLENASEMYRR